MCVCMYCNNHLLEAANWLETTLQTKYPSHTLETIYRYSLIIYLCSTSYYSNSIRVSRMTYAFIAAPSTYQTGATCRNEEMTNTAAGFGVHSWIQEVIQIIPVGTISVGEQFSGCMHPGYPGEDHRKMTTKVEIFLHQLQGHMNQRKTFPSL